MCILRAAGRVGSTLREEERCVAARAELAFKSNADADACAVVERKAEVDADAAAGECIDNGAVRRAATPRARGRLGRCSIAWMGLDGPEALILPTKAEAEVDNV